MYRFPLYTKMAKEEEASMKLLMKKDLSRKERMEVVSTFKVVHSRDIQAREEE